MTSATTGSVSLADARQPCMSCVVSPAGLMCARCTHHAACSEAAMISWSSPIVSTPQRRVRIGRALSAPENRTMAWCCRCRVVGRVPVSRKAQEPPSQPGLSHDYFFCGCVECVSSGMGSHSHKLATAKGEGAETERDGMACHDVAGGGKPRHGLSGSTCRTLPLPPQRWASIWHLVSRLVSFLDIKQQTMARYNLFFFCKFAKTKPINSGDLANTGTI